MKRLVVIPSDPIAAYEKAGYDWLERYYNPQGYFDEVYAVSPLETGITKKYGMTIIGITPGEYKKTIKKIQPDVIRAYGGFWPCDLAVYNKIKGIPVIVSVHDTNKALLNPSIKYANKILCMSNAVAKLVKSYGADEKKIEILPNRIDTKIFCPKVNSEQTLQIRNQHAGKKIILHVGRKSKQKNIDNLIKSLIALPDDHICIFIGLGDKNEYVNLSKQLGVENRCFWIDGIKNSELPFWYSACDCMCTPSRWEGFGIVFIEAAACGAAVITSNIEPMNEYLIHKKNAHLITDYENPEEISAAIKEVCQNEKYRIEIKQEAVKLGEQFGLKKIDARELEIYKEVLSHASGDNFNINLEIAKLQRSFLIKSRHYKHLLVTQIRN